MTSHEVVVGDARDALQLINPDSIQLIITSPPYWQIKDYGISNQIGFGSSYEKYLDDLEQVWKGCFKVLEPGAHFAINVGDLYVRESGEPFRVIPLHSDIIRQNIAIGFDLITSIIWVKVSNKPRDQSGSLRPVLGSFPYPRKGRFFLEHEYILIFSKPGESKSIPVEIREPSKIESHEWKIYFSSVWYFSGISQTSHCAMFPEELPARLIKMFTFKAVPKLNFEGDWILDPFLGSGTTMKAAIELGRNSIGIELNPHFLPLIQEKIGFNQQKLTESLRFRIKRLGDSFEA